MNQARLMQILLAPLESEKANRLADRENSRQYIFKVLSNANKIEVKAAIEFLFEVKVKNVQTVNVKGKTKNFGRTRGKRSDWKKAYVCLEEGYDITLSNA